ncbi:hypothetical protein BCR36DRAFT_404766 [Piromyces finnis]|uniref:G domain-containing protein n=1 Tax=Piromyces finnis TaxID=1754191 RepID=A0A1Y1V8S5_9FUNG|nr:hypothetical protein BCR36DRAFT_404766 [Piromyces finnis]|eukprot:ORX49273.1 hypothetical protein BCR36DRAFT_404766 [Piromyces finnis]
MNHNSYMPENVIIKKRDYTDDYEARERKGKGKERGLFDEKNNSKIYIYNNEDLRRDKWSKDVYNGKRNDSNVSYQILTQNSSDIKKILKSPLKSERGKQDLSNGGNSSLLSTKLNKANQKTELLSLMDENYRILYDQVNKVLVDKVDAFVIGFIGHENVGKTTIVSHFSKIKNNKKGPKLISKKDTVGIDMYLTEERVIILDTQPILRKFKSEKRRRNYENSIPENYSKEPDLWNSIQSFQFALFLFLICHVVVAVSDDINDVSLWQLIKTIENIMESYGSSSDKKNKYEYNALENNINRQYNIDGDRDNNDIYPKIVFVNNKCTPEYFSLEVARNFNRKLNKYFKDSKLKVKGLIKMPDITPENATNVANFFFLPFYKSQDNQNSKTQNSKNVNKHIFKLLIENLRQQIYHIPRKNMHSLLEQENKISNINDRMKHTSVNSLSINTFPKLYEKEWFMISQKIWENIKINFVNENAKLIEESLKTTSSIKRNN